METRDAVDLHIDVNTLDVRALTKRLRGERVDALDPFADWLEDNWEVFGTRDDGLVIACPFEENHSSGAKGDTSTIYFPAGSKGYAHGSLVCLHDSCCDRQQAEFRAKCGYLDDEFASLVETPAPVTHVNGKHLADPLLLPPFGRNGTGGIFCTLENVVTGITHRQSAEVDVAFDTFRSELMLAENPGEWRGFGDADAVDLRMRLERLKFLKPVSKEMMRDALAKAMDVRKFDSAVTWLKDVVPAWDGVARMESFWPRYMTTVDNAYTRALGLYSWTAQAGRALEPGCKVDMVPVLVGAEGLRKSTAVSLLAPDPQFFAEFKLDSKDEELARLMRGCLVGELAELRGINSREAEAVLAWITRRHEKWTPKFKEYAIAMPRRLVFYATTNDTEFLQDHMGKRRWLPVIIRGKIDTDGIEHDRLQLWAEARERFVRDGVLWQQVEELAGIERDGFASEDIWQKAVRRWLTQADMSSERPCDRPFLTTLEVAEGALNIAARAIKFTEQRRIAKALRAEGYEDSVRRVGKDAKPTKVWTPPPFV